MTKKDFLLGGLVGIFLGALSLPIAKGLSLPFVVSEFLIIVFFLVSALTGLVVANILAKRWPIFIQLAKFVLIGGLNTFLDVAVLSILILVSGQSKGLYYSVFKGLSFLTAVVNSYFWNKYWTFGSSAKAEAKQFFQFLIVSIIGFAINVGTASLIVDFIKAPAGVSPQSWAILGATAATAISLIWNFLGYKLVVFTR